MIKKTKILSRIRNLKELFQSDRRYLEKCTNSIILLMGKDWILSKIRKSVKISFLTISIQHHTAIPCKWNKAKK